MTKFVFALANRTMDNIFFFMFICVERASTRDVIVYALRCAVYKTRSRLYCNVDFLDNIVLHFCKQVFIFLEKIIN